MQIIFHGIASNIQCKVMFLVMLKMVLPNKPNSMIFRTELGLDVIIEAKGFTCIEIVQYSRHKKKQ